MPKSSTGKIKKQRVPVGIAIKQICQNLALGLTPVATRALEHAAACSCENEGTQLGSYELLRGLCHERESASCVLLEKSGFSQDQIAKRAAFLLDRYTVPSLDSAAECSLTPRAEHVLRESRSEAQARGHEQVSTLHVLAALVAQRQGVVTVILEWPGRGIEPLIEAIEQAFLDQLQDPA